jgi:hypothetical protein
MSKFLGRAFGGYKATEKLVVIDIESLDAKTPPKCDTLVIECKRNDKHIRSNEIHAKS